MKELNGFIPFNHGYLCQMLRSASDDELNNIINNQFWEYLKSPYCNEDKKASKENYKAITDLIEFQLRDINADIRNHLASLSIV